MIVTAKWNSVFSEILIYGSLHFPEAAVFGTFNRKIFKRKNFCGRNFAGSNIILIFVA